MVLARGVTVGGRALFEHLEVIGHRDAMGYLEQMAAASTSIGEWEIRNLHSLILQPIDGATGSHDAGRYRTLDVRAAGTEYVYPAHYQVPDLIAILKGLVQEIGTGRERRAGSCPDERHLPISA